MASTSESVLIDEQTPLLSRASLEGEPFENSRRMVYNPRLWFIVLLFTFGATIGGYLLYMQAQDYPISKPFFLVHRLKWGAQPLRPTGPAYPESALTYVLIVQASRKCLDMDSCSTILRNIQKCDKAKDVPFNFLVGGDGNTYEGQGWRNQSLLSLPTGAGLAIRTESSLVLAFIGNFTALLPNSDQLEEALVWIAESIAQHRLRESYVLVGVRNLTRASNDGQRLFRELERWPNYNSTIGAYL